MVSLQPNNFVKMSSVVTVILLLQCSLKPMAIGCDSAQSIGYLFHHRATGVYLRFPLKPSVMKRRIRREDLPEALLDIHTAIRKDNLALSLSARPLKNILGEAELCSYVERLVESMQAEHVIIKKISVNNIFVVHYSLTLQRAGMTYYVEQLTFCARKHLVSINCTYVNQKQKMDAWKYFNTLKIAPKMDSK